MRRLLSQQKSAATRSSFWLMLRKYFPARAGWRLHGQIGSPHQGRLILYYSETASAQRDAIPHVLWDPSRGRPPV